MAAIEAQGPTVAWRRVALFYGIAFAGIALVGVALATIGGSMRDALLSVAFGATAMVMPFVAGVLTERRAGRPLLLGREWRRFRQSPGRVLGRVVAWTTVGFLVLQGVGLVGTFLLQDVPGAGRWATQRQFDDALAALNPALEGQSIPIAAMLGLSLVQALVAGFTINGIFGFGEEYGWRGVLAEELAPLGMVRANLLTGVLWGLWHAPLIMLGHNYGDAWLPGIFLFVLVTTPLSFILWWARERSGSVVAPAMLHGAFNGFAGLYLLLLVDVDRLLAAPVGVLAGVLFSVAAVVLWWVPGLRPVPGSAQPPALPDSRAIS